MRTIKMDAEGDRSVEKVVRRCMREEWGEVGMRYRGQFTEAGRVCLRTS